MKALMTLKELLEEYYTSFKVGYTRYHDIINRTVRVEGYCR